MTQKTERRKHPRIKDKNIAIKLSGQGVSAITQSLDVSASGVYCKVDHEIPLMTKVQVVLSLPGDPKNSSSTMDIEGVVVREHPVMIDGKVDHYDVAIFFHDLLPKEKKKLMKYIGGRTE